MLAFACALYYAVERPALALRDRLVRNRTRHSMPAAPVHEVVGSI
jgi:hypothetical protein